MCGNIQYFIYYAIDSSCLDMCDVTHISSNLAMLLHASLSSFIACHIIYFIYICVMLLPMLLPLWVV